MSSGLNVFSGEAATRFKGRLNMHGMQQRVFSGLASLLLAGGVVGGFQATADAQSRNNSFPSDRRATDSYGSDRYDSNSYDRNDYPSDRLSDGYSGSIRPTSGTRPSSSPRREFGGRSQTAKLAEDLVLQANFICVQMNKHYQGNRDYRNTYREMYGVLDDAKQIRDLIKVSSQRGPQRGEDKIEVALHHMDRQFHQIDAELRRWRPENVERNTRGPKQDIQLAGLLDDFEDTLHGMMDDYGVRSRLDLGANSRVPSGPARNQAIAPAPDYRR